MYSVEIHSILHCLMSMDRIKRYIEILVPRKNLSNKYMNMTFEKKLFGKIF